MRSFRFLTWSAALSSIWGVLAAEPAASPSQSHEPDAARLADETPEIRVLESSVVDLAGRAVTLQRIADPGLRPSPRGSETGETNTLDTRSQTSTWFGRAADVRHLTLSATVVDGRATLLGWSHDGVGYKAWSNADFSLLAPITRVEANGTRYDTILLSRKLSSEMLPPGSVYTIPDGLPEEPARFVVFDGDITDVEATRAVAALHEWYRTEHPRLLAAALLRERENARRQAAPEPEEDVVLHFWKVQPERPRVGRRVEGGAR